MKIGILTFHCAINYGAILQTYGLQEFLKSKGHDVFIIDYRPAYLLEPYSIFTWNWDSNKPFIKNILLFIRSLFVLPIRLKRKKKFSLFIEKHINIHPLNLSNETSDFSAFIFGSDQIWNTQITHGFDKVYFGYFAASKNKRLISYAASAGNIKCISSRKDEFMSLLSNYTNISAREQSLADFINKSIVKNNCYVTLDPVLLAGKETFTSIASKRKLKKPYLLIFKIASDEPSIIRKIAEDIAKKKKLTIIELTSIESIKSLTSIAAASPEYFISLFRDASYIITSSYHGTIFSILFEKNFNTIGVNNVERMSHLLSAIGLKDRLIYPKSINIKSDEINYHKVNEIIQKMRIKSIDYLKQSLYNK